MFEKIWERMSCAISEQACGPLMRSPRAPHVVLVGAVLVTLAPDKPKRLIGRGINPSLDRGEFNPRVITQNMRERRDDRRVEPVKPLILVHLDQYQVGAKGGQRSQ